MKGIKTFLLVIIVLAFAIFTFQNFEKVTITIFKWGITLPLAFTLIAIYILGMLTGGLLWSNLKRLAKDVNTKESK